ncbi:unnamed protein product, partial [Ectocarpus sp. 12 AP-2014]
AKSWAVRREALTHQYVSRLAAEAQQTGQAALNSNGDESKDDSRRSGAAPVHPRNLSNLSAKALEELFRDSNVDPKDFDDMDYAQKRLL